MASRARLTPYARGIAYGMSLAGAKLAHIANTVVKTDGAHPCQQSIADCLDLCKANGGVRWNGDVKALSDAGRPRETTPEFDKSLAKLVAKHRGSSKAISAGCV